MVLFFYNYTRIPTSKLIPCVSLEGLIHPFRSQYTYVFLPAGGMYRRGRLMTAAAWGWHGGRHQLCYRWQARVIDPLLKRCARWASRPTPAPSYPSNCFVFSFFFFIKMKIINRKNVVAMLGFIQHKVTPQAACVCSAMGPKKNAMKSVSWITVWESRGFFTTGGLLHHDQGWIELQQLNFWFCGSRR